MFLTRQVLAESVNTPFTDAYMSHSAIISEANFVATDGTGVCQNDNIQCSQ